MNCCLQCPCPTSDLLIPDGLGRTGVLIVTDALMASEGHMGKVLAGREGAMLARALSRYGWEWDDFFGCAAAFCHPTPRWATQAARECARFDQHVNALKPKVFLSVGALAFERLTGQRVSPLLARGYVWPEVQGRGWVVAALPPLYYRQDPGMLITFLSDVAKAVRIAEQGFTYDTTCVPVWNPSASRWDAYVREFLADPTRRLAADIETPYKRQQDMSEAEKRGPDLSLSGIDEVNLCWNGLEGISVEFNDLYRPGIEAILTASQAHGVTLFWNDGYDVPRLEKHTNVRFTAAHTCDVMDTFRVWRNSVRRKLVVATSLLPSCWNVKPWKHLGTADPFYRAMDVISLWRNDQDLRRLLEAEGQSGAYQLCVSQLDPLLDRMTQAGLATDAPKVEQLSTDLDARLTALQAQMTLIAPAAILPTKTWQTRKAAEKGVALLRERGEVLSEAPLVPIPATTTDLQCAACGEVGVKREHVTRKR